MMNVVRFWNYGDYSSNNYGAHTLAFSDTKGNTFWFSYDTVVAFNAGGEFHIVKNLWGPTTGKHLNWINSDKTIREDYDTFMQNYERLTRE